MQAWIQLFAAVGLVGCFLPLVSGISWWEMRHMGWVVYAVVAAFSVPLIVRDARILTGAFAFIVYESPSGPARLPGWWTRSASLTIRTCTRPIAM